MQMAPVLSEKNSARKKALQRPGSPSNAADAGIFYRGQSSIILNIVT